MNKSRKVVYYVVTTLFALFMLVDGLAGLVRIEEGQEIMEHLGYPVYVLSILGLAKVLGAIGIVQNRFVLLKEWAYAGFVFHFLGACASRSFVGDSFLLIISPLLFLGFMLISYILWKKTRMETHEHKQVTSRGLIYT